jgi:ribonucleoside-diphosphate reductase alpha chain
MNDMKVLKRNNKYEDMNMDKIHKVIDWSCHGLDNVYTSQVALKAHIQFVDGMKTSEIHETIIKAAADLISVEQHDYAYVASRLLMFHLRKEAYGQFSPPTLFDQIEHMVNLGKYDKELLTKYTLEEINELDDYLNHDRDLDFKYSGMKQMQGKYLVQNRVTKTVYESPQFAYICIGMALFGEYTTNKMDCVKRFYDATSQFKLSLPTPIMSGVRTPTRQFSSCVLIECADSLKSINATSAAIIEYISLRAGIGVNAGSLRALGSSIRGGEAYHTGVIPFYKHFQTAVKSCSQGGVRGGAATLFYPFWHLEFENLVVLKNNRGTEETRVRHLDYGVQMNSFLWERVKSNGKICLFSPSDVKGLYEAFFADQTEFKRLYEEAENNPSIRRKEISALDLMTMFAQERAQTGRIYIQNVDHCNEYGKFIPEVAPIKQSNLCLEIALPTEPVGTENEEIALCTLAAFNLGKIDSLDELEGLSDIAVRALDALLDYQDYPVKAAEKALLRRSLGVGVTNYDNYLAKHGKKYSDGSGNNLTHELFESVQYYLLKASNNLAKEFGKCGLYHETKYSQGILPVDLYKKDIDGVHTATLLKDWESLRTDIAKYGLRNSTLTAQMPCESSSQVTNSTNGIEPPRGLVSVKSSKEGLMRQVVDDVDTLTYETLWDIPNNKGYIELVGIMQKFMDQSISANTNYDPEKFEDGKVPAMTIIKDMAYAYKLGLKTLYYHNTRDNADEDMDDDDGCEGGACKL